MKRISNVLELKQAITQLEIKQAADQAALKSQFRITYESLKPINLILNSLKEIGSAPDLKGNLLNSSLALTAGYFSKKIMVGSTLNPLKQIVGTLLQFGVTNLVSKNGGDIKSSVLKVLSQLLSKKKPVAQEEEVL